MTPLAAFVIATSEVRAAAKVCAADDTESAALRSALEYCEVSPDPKRPCAKCAYFTAPTSGTCGTCKIFGGGPANVGGHCNSWSPQA